MLRTLTPTVCLALVLSASAFAAEPETEPPAVPPPLAYLPDSHHMAAVIRPAEMFQEQHFTGDLKWKTVREQVTPDLFGAGLGPCEELEWLGVSGPTFSPQAVGWAPVFFVQTKKPVPLERALGFIDQPVDDVEPVEIGGEFCLQAAGGAKAVWSPAERLYFVSSVAGLKDVITRREQTAKPSPIARALATAIRGHEMAAVLDSEAIAGLKALFASTPEAPPGMTLLQRLDGISGSLSLVGDARMSLTLTPADGTEVDELKTLTAELLKLAGSTLAPSGKESPMEITSGVLRRGLEALQMTTDTGRLTLTSRLDDTQAARDAFLEVYIEEQIRAKFRPMRHQRQNNLKQVLLAMHTRADAANYQAPLLQDITDENGKPLLSWRVALLPHMEQQKLYDRFRLDEPWDSKHNKQLLTEIPPLYAAFVMPGEDSPQPGQTNIVALTGPGTAFGLGEQFRINKITDGTSNTVVIVDLAARTSVPWTKPEDFPFDPQQPLAMFAGEEPLPLVLFGTVDGAVHTVGAIPTPERMRAMVTPAGGEALDDE